MQLVTNAFVDGKVSFGNFEKFVSVGFRLIKRRGKTLPEIESPSGSRRDATRTWAPGPYKEARREILTFYPFLRHPRTRFSAIPRLIE